MEIKRIPLDLIDLNEGQIQGLPRNPRTWTLSRLEKLAASIERIPELTEARPPLVVEHGGRYVAIGGNMRIAACRHLDVKEVLCAVFQENELSAPKLKEIAIKDNSKFGSWDTDALANEWHEYDLTDFGLPDFSAPSQSPSDRPAEPVDDRTVIEIPLTPDEFNFVTSALRQVAPTPEDAVLKLLGL